MIEERLELAYGRLKEISGGVAESRKDKFLKDFAITACRGAEIVGKMLSGEFDNMDLESLQDYNKAIFYGQVEEYDTYPGNPKYAAEVFGQDLGPILSAAFCELEAGIFFGFDGKKEQVTCRMELAIQLWLLFQEGEPGYEEIKECLYSFFYDNLEAFMDDRINDYLVPQKSVAEKIIETANLTDIRYLYGYGEYIGENEILISRYMSELSGEKVEKIAETFVEGYRKGFEATGKDISKKSIVEIRYPIGFERIIRASADRFREINMEPVYRREEKSFFMGRRLDGAGFIGVCPNKQYIYDHENDRALIFDKKFLERKLEAYRDALEKHKNHAEKMGGPAVMETFGNKPFIPAECGQAIRPDEKTRKLFTEYAVRASDLVNKYIRDDERSFTIISFPSTELGECFEAVFDETIVLNTLDYNLYRDMQQIIIDELDKAENVVIKGKNGNETDLKVAMQILKNPEKETNFENCVADVNIPVGEVFTSPRLEGTEGLLHVKYVYLNGRPYKNLKLNFKDGMVTDYSCENFDSAEKNREYIREKLLNNHETLPLGEFAIGTNTIAYKMIRKYNLEDVMTILIQEKTGPHFAIGDTCYSHDEEGISYNPDGKAIVARENTISALRKTDPLKAYFNCHTDITIPYDELDYVRAVGKDSNRVDIIQDGRFVLKGLEELNKPLDNH